MGICPARVKKLQISTNICGEKLKNCGYEFKWSVFESPRPSLAKEGSTS